MKKKQTGIIFRQGKKVILRPIEESDIPLLQKWMNDPEVTQYLRMIMPVTFVDERSWFERVSKSVSDKITLALVDRITNKLIGTMGMHSIDFVSGTATTGSAIGDKNFWNKGYGSEAKMLLLEFAFNELNLRKVYSDVIAYNKRSLAYANKCGYIEEARIPKHYYRKGKYWDKVILAVYRKPWNELWKNYIA